MFTNERLDDYISKLSADRWLQLHIILDLSIEFRKENSDDTSSPVKLSVLDIKK